MLKKIVILFILCFIFSCNHKDEIAKDKNTVTLNFFNESSFKVDIYRNVNPSRMDASTPPIATIAPSSTFKVKLPPSENQMIGDVFYIRYYVQLADSFSSGTKAPLYVQAERDISNIAFVLKDGESYTKKIVQPLKESLRFVNGYIKVQNTGDKSFQVIQGSTYLKKLGTSEPNLATGSFGFYELAISSFDENTHMSSLKFYVTGSGTSINVPAFLLERGKIYSFQCDGTEVVFLNTKDIKY